MPNAFALAGSNLVELNTNVTTVITGVTAGETLVGIDYRPINGFLYGLGVNASTDTATLYAISTRTGAAGVVGGAPGQIAFTTTTGTSIDLPDPATAGYGFDFNPAVDRIRVTTDTGLNLRINPNTGQAVDSDGVAGNGVNPDGALNGGATGASGAAYTNNQPNNGGITTLYGLDPATNQLFIQNPPNNGTETSPKALTLGGVPIDFSAVPGFDIPAGVNAPASNAPVTSGSGFALLTTGGGSALVQIDLTTGAVTGLGVSTATGVAGLAVENDYGGAPAIATDGTNLIRFNTATPGTTTTVAISGLTGGLIEGVDYRPATGQLYALGVTQTVYFPGIPDGTGGFLSGFPPMTFPGGDATLYLIDPQTGAATSVASLGNLGADGGYGFDFNPTADRIRITTEAGLNIRVNPNSGVITNDTAINGGTTGISAAAYTNDYAGTTTTTLYTIDTTTDALFVQNPPNGGTENLVGPLGVDAADIDGFDILASFGGRGIAALQVGGITSLYQINLATGAATLLGPIGTGVTPISGLALGNIPNPAPVISSNGGGATATISVAENSTAVTTVVAADPDGSTVGYSIVGGADAAKFTINASTGALAFAAAPNFEAPGSLASSNTYQVFVRASDGLGGADNQALAINVTDVIENSTSPTITTPPNFTTPENLTVSIALASTDPDLQGTNPAIFSITGGADAARFAITGAPGSQQLRSLTTFDFERDPHSFQVQVSASDGANISSETITVGISDVNGAPLFGTVVTDPNSPLASIVRLYDTTLDRPGEIGGLEYWADRLEGGASLTGAANEFIASQEFASRFGTLNNHDFVDRLYANAFGRDSDADPTGLTFWTTQLDAGQSRATVALAISDSPEHRTATASTLSAGVYVPNYEASEVARLYYGVLGRAPDAPGLQGFVAAADSGTPIATVANSFVGSPEFQAKHPGGLSNHDFVDLLYANALGRDSDTDPGAPFIVAALNSGASRGAVAVAITDSPEAAIHLAPPIEDGFLLT